MLSFSVQIVIYIVITFFIYIILAKTCRRMLVMKKIFEHEQGKTAACCIRCQFDQYTQQYLVEAVRVGLVLDCLVIMDIN